MYEHHHLISLGRWIPSSFPPYLPSVVEWTGYLSQLCETLPNLPLSLFSRFQPRPPPSPSTPRTTAAATPAARRPEVLPLRSPPASAARPRPSGRPCSTSSRQSFPPTAPRSPPRRPPRRPQPRRRGRRRDSNRLRSKNEGGESKEGLLWFFFIR